jgi:hypothetical protein
MPLPILTPLFNACIGGCCWLAATSLLTRFPLFSPTIPSQRRAPSCKVFAHRGAAQGAAENTLQAFQAALKQVPLLSVLLLLGE